VSQVPQTGLVIKSRIIGRGPAGMAADAVAKINAAVARVLRSDELAKAAELHSIGFSPASPEETARTIRDDRTRFTKLIRDIGLERQ
jgi:tripartite-type tricarboxylate transporter receptor subunit TctC